MTKQPIVIVDDSGDDIFLATRLIRDAGFENPIVSFSTPHAAAEFLDAKLRSAKDEPWPLVVFIDVNMGRYDGFVLLRWMEARPIFRSIPRVMLSGSERMADVIRSRELGACCFLKKHPPADVFRKLLTAIAEHQLPTAKQFRPYPDR